MGKQNAIEELVDSFTPTKLSPPKQQTASVLDHKFKALASEITESVGGREITVALRKLREAKNCVMVALSQEQKAMNRAAAETAGQ